MTIDCQRAGAWIEARLDGEITAADDRLLDAHVAACPGCAAQLAAETALDRQLAARFGGVEAPAALSAAVRRRIEVEPAPAPSRAGWIADALNAGGVMAVAAMASVVAPMLSVTGGLLTLALVAMACYPLVLSGLAGDVWPTEAGPAEAGPARAMR
jgi:anti-sigma factor (TIGR02949 family)